ncbi:HAD family hydrolase [Shouchella lehensis]|uniref:HAD family hydrolase n=1 Tax=Shouchella lehensis TaxID=300825 RepID=A0A4Y7WL43_9BACI|nr:HAD family hydrolase [Shouchella lehensis]MBG9783402.1 HAD family hydrolase [Shouchella lehensis]RQW22392.1 HAD family hydrolase [Bacillus sp. C1-1]TES49210.1 HAD family hydrolase [Shouchella lehensis]
MDSIIFDLDGTLWDSREQVVEAWNKAIGKSEFPIEKVEKADLTRTMGLVIPEIARVLFPQLTEREQKQLMDACGVEELALLKEKGAVLYDGLEEVLLALSNTYKLFIVSNCRDGYIEAFFHSHGLSHYFTDYENPGRTGLPKGENIKLIVERNGLQAPLYVGDTIGDQKAAHHAGVRFAYASYGFGQSDHHDYKLTTFKDLLQFA